MPHTILEFDLDMHVMSLTDVLTCLNIRKKDIKSIDIQYNSQDWLYHRLTLCRKLSCRKVAEEFDGTLVIRDICINGIRT